MIKFQPMINILNSDVEFLHIITYNARSFDQNIHIFTALLASISYEPDIIILTETWITKDNEDFSNLSGYFCFYTTSFRYKSG